MIRVEKESPFVVLLAEDSEHDIRAVERIWQKNEFRNPLKIVRDGAECLDYLLRQGRFSDPETSPWPGVLLLDINLPKCDGFEVLRRIKESPRLRRLPVVMLTTSDNEEDVRSSYELGANAYLPKPVGSENLSKALLAFNLFWETARLPTDSSDGRT